MQDTYKNYEDLGNAIVLTAVRDYRLALKKLENDPNHGRALSTKREVEKFFRSDLYKLITSLDGDMLIKKLNEEVGYIEM